MSFRLDPLLHWPESCNRSWITDAEKGKALVFCGIKDVGVIGASKGFPAVEGDRVAGHLADSKKFHPEVIALLLAMPRTT